MGTTNKEIIYRCSDDCNQAGCPTHTAKMIYQSTSDLLRFEDGKRTNVCFERGSLEAFMTLLAHIGHGRVEIRDVIESAYRELKKEEL